MSPATIDKTDKLELLSEAKFEEKQGVSQAEYARMRNMTRQNVHKHIQSGIITTLPNGNIDPEAADKEMADKLDPAHAQGNKGTEHIAPTNGKGAKGEDSNTFNFNRIKTLEKGYDVKIKELAYKKMAGEVVNKKKVESAFSSKITAVVRRLQKISKRISPAVAKESDRVKCEAMILNEIKEAVEEFGQHG
jgi:oligoribonuclease (3'-5' exoribonuclease)